MNGHGFRQNQQTDKHKLTSEDQDKAGDTVCCRITNNEIGKWFKGRGKTLVQLSTPSTSFL